MAKAETKQTPDTVAVPAESVYEAHEIAKNAEKLFGVNADIATAALSMNQLKRCTLAEAKRVIIEFANRKVK